ncbi:malto-oligosyltrehalose trehalohydrolase [Sorangium cellulosum]|uniref:Malto-oligosyltrehalose trehalohydrolase n=1 Tax=Sorangium cellulosum TaxID=56 RepID=A0A4P2PYH1_SORCE|nr:malto-oligosyltrehalose trehalohydrolase [Sorangium cellulosum]AUX21626.1 malto-oligosyltrehalose trehalohydrolase [Sorangium cellulosum]
MSVFRRMGAWIEGGAVRFRVWAPDHERVEIVTYGEDGQAITGAIEARPEGGGYFEATAPGLGAGALYKVRLDGEGPFPDPYSRAQPRGVHGPSAVDDPSFAWTDAGWGGVALEDLVIYEVHVGTATPEGTFDALIGRLGELRALGVTAIELMPVASFPGARGWGYDGVDLFAPAASYGGPAGLRRLVDAAHAAGLGVLLDCVYNHLGPDGNYLRAYAKRYFTERHTTPWGEAVNYDGEGAEQVRALVITNAEMWIRDYHIDGLRLDATHAILDDTEPHILREIAERARAAGAGRRVVVIAEDSQNDARLVTPVEQGGYGLDAVWADDFHHELRVCFAGDRDGYFEDHRGTAEDIAATIRKGWLYEGQVSRHAGKPRGTPAEPVPPPRFVHCIQNHDQIGNRALGDRLGERVSPAAFRAMSALLLVTPYTPLLFMGQEWNARTPFQYFTDHHPELGRLVTEGRRREFRYFTSFSGAEVPDPQDPATFQRSKLSLGERERPEHAGVLAWYRALLALRATHPAMKGRARRDFSVEALSPDAIRVERRGGEAAVVALVALRGALSLDLGGADARVLAFSEEPRFGGAAASVGAPLERGRVDIEGPAALILEVRRA